MRRAWTLLLLLTALPLLSSDAFALSADQQARGQAAVDRLNLYRKLSGLPPVTLDVSLCDGAVAHAQYLNLNPDQVFNGLAAHNEDPSRPGYSAAGAEAGKNGDIFYGGTGSDAIDGWYETYYHRNPMVNPGVTKVGYGDDPGSALGFSVAVLEFVTYTQPGDVLTPGNGSDGNAVAGFGEVPAPVTNFGPQTGNPIIAYFSGVKVAWVSSTITANGQTLSHAVIAPNKPVNSTFEVNEICLITDAPLPKGATITVEINYSQNGDKKVSWSFKTSATGAFDVNLATASAGNLPAGGGGTPSVDSDGDGFLDEIEAAAGTSASDPTSTPFSGQPAGTAQALPADKLSIKLSFAAQGKDSIMLSGTLPFADGTSLTGQQVIVFVGGVARRFSLDDKGKSVNSLPDSLKLGPKPHDGFIKYTARIMKGTFSTALADEGLTSADVVNESRQCLVEVLFGNTVYQTTQALTYSAKKGKTGSAK